MKRIVCSLFLGAAVLLASGCNSTTVLLANFNAEAIGAPPAAAQPTGFVEYRDGAGSVRVATAPTGAAGGQKWLQISHADPKTDTPEMRARFDAAHGAGKYNLLTALLIPTGTGAVSLDIETLNGSINSSPNFLHLDFMPQNNVRINDNDADRFGTFPRDTSFVLSILVDTAVSPPTARVSLLGEGSATGQRDLVLPAIGNAFGAVRWWMGTQWTGSFFVDDVLVTKQNP